jgi:hypothetical protein
MIADVRVALFVAKLYKGATVSVDRRKVNGEVWLPARVRLNLSGRALVRKFNVESVIEFSDYRKFSVETGETFKVPK